MPRSEVSELLGTPDVMGSGVDFCGYNDVGTFFFSGGYDNNAGILVYSDEYNAGEAIASRITIGDNTWDIDEFISEAVIRKNNEGRYYVHPGSHPTESHVVIAIPVLRSFASVRKV